MGRTVAELMSTNISNAITNLKTWGGLIYNITAFGAIGDGKTDDTIAIQKAINAAESNGGGTVVFPPGTYLAASNINASDNVAIWFMKGAVLVIDAGVTITINGPLIAGVYQIFDGDGTISGNPKLENAYPQWFGATGDGVTDDTAAFRKVFEFACNCRVSVHIPKPEAAYGYITTGGFVITEPIQVTSDQSGTWRMNLADDTEIGIQLKINGGQHGTFIFPFLYGNGKGTAIQLESSSVSHVEWHTITNFNVGFHLKSDTAQCLNNTVVFDFTANVNTGIRVESNNGKTIEGNKFDFNFITECKYGIEIVRNSGSIVYNEINGNTIHATRTNCVCIYGDGLEASQINIRGFVGADNGAAVGGPGTQGGKDNFFDGNNNTFNLYIDHGEVNIKGSQNFVNNVRSQQNSGTTASGIPLATSANSIDTWNGGNPVNTNYTLVEMNLPNGPEGTTVSGYMYHHLCSHGFAKKVEIVYTNTSIPEDFVLVGIDQSYASNKELRIVARYTKEISTPKTIKFLVGFN